MAMGKALKVKEKAGEAKEKAKENAQKFKDKATPYIKEKAAEAKDRAKENAKKLKDKIGEEKMKHFGFKEDDKGSSVRASIISTHQFPLKA